MKRKKQQPKRKTKSASRRRKRVVVRKPKQYTVKIGQKIETRFKLKQGEKLVWRDRFGKIRKNPRGDLKLIGEIRDKKTGKVKAYTNYIIKGEVIPRKFKRSYQKFLELKRRPKKPMQREIAEVSFRLNTSKTILEQIRNQAHEAIEMIDQIKKENGYCPYWMKMNTQNAKLNSQVINVARGTRKHDIGYQMASMVIQSMHENGVRISPKPLAAVPNQPHMRTIDVTVKIVDDLL